MQQGIKLRIMKGKPTCNLLILLLAVLGAGAIFGGVVLMISPSGNWFGMPLSILRYSPFSSFFFPGMILFFVLGIVPVGLAIVLVKRPANRLAQLFNAYGDMYWGWAYSIYTAFALIIWIQSEMIFLRAVHWLHTFYMFLSITILFVALLPQVRNVYKK